MEALRRRWCAFVDEAAEARRRCRRHLLEDRRIDRAGCEALHQAQRGESEPAHSRAVDQLAKRTPRLRAASKVALDHQDQLDEAQQRDRVEMARRVDRQVR